MSQPLEKGDLAPVLHNIASGDANVGAQIGVVRGNVHLGWKSASPAQKAEHGESLLKRGMARDAEKALGDAISEGCNGSRVAYFWALAILSGRSLKQVEADHLNNLDTAFRMVRVDATDTWAEALRVIKGLIDLLSAVDRQATVGSTTECDALVAYDRLAPDRSAEIRRYLDQVLDGVVLEHIHKAANEEAARGRMADGRACRAWKFFEPVPTAPEWIPPPSRSRPLWAWLKFGAGLVLASGSMVLLVPPVMVRAGDHVVERLLMLVIGLIGLVHWSLRRQFLLDEREIEQRMFAMPMEGDLPWNPEGQERFIERMVAGAFNRCAPSPEEKKVWKQATRWYRLNLTRQFAEVYEAPEVRRRPTTVRWLATWHARQLVSRWDPERPGELSDTAPAPARTMIGIVAAAVVTTMGAVLLWVPILATRNIVDSFLLPLLVLSGVRVAVDQGCWLISSARALAKDVTWSNQRYQREAMRFEELCETLRDRPNDEEMAGWLAYDERYLRAKAMELYQVTYPELIAHFSFAVPTDDARHMTAPGGPKRYTEYIVGAMLMTRGGVRMAEFHLNMCTGEDEDPERRSFRYDAIASVQVKTARADRCRPSGRGSKKAGSAKQMGGDDSMEERLMEKPGYRTVVGIVLMNGALAVEAIFDVFDDEIEDARQGAHELVARALDASGVAGALWMIEAINADGKEWLQEEEARSSRRRYRSRQESATGLLRNENGHASEPSLT